MLLSEVERQDVYSQKELIALSRDVGCEITISQRKSSILESSARKLSNVFDCVELQTIRLS